MRSSVPKPLHRVLGRPLVAHVAAALDPLVTSTVVVVHPDRSAVADAVREVTGGPVVVATQPEPRGTGDAVRVALGALGTTAGDVLVTPADVPLLSTATLAALVDLHRRPPPVAATLLTAEVADPTGYGRVVRAADGSVTAVVEHADATPAQREIREINSSVYCFAGPDLAGALERLRPDNAQGELYLTDVIAGLVTAGRPVRAHRTDAAEVAGVNDRAQLAAVTAEARRRRNHGLMVAGVTMDDPAGTTVEVTATVGVDVHLGAGVILAGTTRVGDGATIGAHSVLTDVTVAPGTRVPPHTVVSGGRLGPQ